MYTQHVIRLPDLLIAKLSAYGFNGMALKYIYLYVLEKT